MSAGTTIGSVEIPVVTNIDRSESRGWKEINLVDKDKTILFGQEIQAKSISIDIVLIESLHSQNKPIERQRQDIKDLIDNDYTQNDINYKDISGKIVIESVDIPKTSDTRNLIQGNISGYLL
jgi:hypothetical protein